jgi:hypothetical protein
MSSDRNRMSPEEVAAGLRRQLFDGDLGAVAPLDDLKSTSNGAPEVLGVAMEVGLPKASYLVFGLRDGSASLYFSTGGGHLGGQGTPSINAAAKSLVETGRAFAEAWPVVKEHPLPSPGRVRFSILTSAGVRAAEVAEEELEGGGSPLYPLFKAAHEIITGFRLREQQEPRDERSYLNCLLTTLARGSTAAVTMMERKRPPDPADLTQDPSDLKWIAKIRFDLERLDTAKIIHLVLSAAGLQAFGGKADGEIRTRVLRHGGAASVEAVFLVRRRRGLFRTVVEIRRVRS